MAALAVVCTGGGQTSEGSTVFKGDNVPGGINYTWSVTMGAGDSATLINTVGGWGWDQDGSDPGTKGWTHNSNWIALTLEQPAVITMTFQSEAGVPDPGDPESFAGTALIPGFSLYSGLENSAMMVHHEYANTGAIFWAPGLTYINGGAASAPVQFLQASFTLPAGVYTVAFGGAAPIQDEDIPQGYRASFTTTAVPEPGAAFSALAGCAALLGFRRSRRTAIAHC